MRHKNAVPGSHKRPLGESLGVGVGATAQPARRLPRPSLRACPSPALFAPGRCFWVTFAMMLSIEIKQNQILNEKTEFKGEF
jgi:hypothetical protein